MFVCILCLVWRVSEKDANSGKMVPTTLFFFQKKGFLNFIYNPLKKSLLKNANLIQSKKTFNLDLADRIIDKYKILHK